MSHFGYTVQAMGKQLGSRRRWMWCYDGSAWAMQFRWCPSMVFCDPERMVGASKGGTNLLCVSGRMDIYFPALQQRT